MEEIQLYTTNLDDVICPICLDFPHNAVLLQCTSFGKGCRSFVCDTDHLHSNCLDRFIKANGMSSGTLSPSSTGNLKLLDSGWHTKPVCPLCRGEVYGYMVYVDARMHLDEKRRCCEEEKCAYTGTYVDLRRHVQVEHPHACPSKVDPARKLDWENFQRSSEIIDVLSTIRSQVPHGVVLGDYVIEYGGNSSGDDLDDLPVDQKNWWTSCILYQCFDNFRGSRNRRRSRTSNSRRGNHHSRYEISNSDEGSAVSSVEYADHRTLETEDEFVTARRLAREIADRHSYTRRRSRINGSQNQTFTME